MIQLRESLTSFEGEDWLRGLDSNQDSQIQSLESYQLDDPGADDSSVAGPTTVPKVAKVDDRA